MIISGLAAVNVFLGAMFFSGERLTSEAPGSVDPKAAPPKQTEPLVGRPALQSLTATSEFPLFTRGRQPAAAAPVPMPEAVEMSQPAPSEDPPDLRAVIIRGRYARALLMAGTELSWVEIGQTFRGWEIGSIEPRQVEMRTSERSLSIHLFRPQANTP